MDSLESQITPSQQHIEEEGVTFVRTCFNGINALSGIGILAIPYALSQGGWVSLPILFIAAILFCYTGLLLQRCVIENPLAKSYPDIGELAFGARGRALVSIFLYLELYFVAVEFLILEGDNLAKMFPNGLGSLGLKFLGVKKDFIILTALIILPTTWLKSLGLLAYVSMGGVFASIAIIVSVFCTGAFGGVGFQENGLLWDLKGMPTSISLISFCYCGHAVFPSLCISMKDKSRFNKVLLICFVVSTIIYATMGISGYLMFGQHLESQITLNLPVKKVSAQIAIYTTLINPLTKYALVITPIATEIEDRLQLFTTNMCVLRITIRSMIVISTVMVALIFPFFGYVMAFTGALLSITVSILFPCLGYLQLSRLRRSQTSRFETHIILFIFGVGLLVGLMGTYISVNDVVNGLVGS